MLLVFRFLLLFILAGVVSGLGSALETCAFLLDGPIVEQTIPSYLHTLKFHGFEAKVFRHDLGMGETPKLKIIRYSSTPIIEVDDESKEVRISNPELKCTNTQEESSGFSLSTTTTSSSSSTTTIIMTLAMAAWWSSGSGGAHPLSTALTSLVLGVSAVLSSSKTALFVSGVNVQDNCQDVMEVVLEAPPYYLGSVDECRLNVENPDHCPNDFPTYPECSDPNPSCKLAVVGAGTGGLYTAMRLIETGSFDAEDVCIFEATERVGGRLYSLRGFGPEDDISVDAGGYRSWPQFTPTLHALITEKLGLNMDCYDESDPCEVYNIVTETGEKAGFATFVEEMMSRLISEGVCYFSRHELTKIDHYADTGTNALTFSNGVVGTATNDVILNVPQRPLLSIIRKSNIGSMTHENEYEIYDALHSVQTEIVVKLYLYYEDAWWLKLGLTEGDFELTGDARNMLLAGRYHDGHVKCDNDNANCHGFLLAVYTFDFGGVSSQYFRRFQKDRPEPVTVISNTDVEGSTFLRHAHERLRQYHIYENSNASYTGFQAEQIFNAATPPEFAVLSTWNIGTYGAGGGWHHWTDTQNIEKALYPLNEYNIHVVNEAYSKLQGWAEGSLLLADEVLEKYFGVERDWNFDAPEYVQFVAQTSSAECAEVDDDSDSGGGGGGGSGEEETIDLCFTGDALVQMADGSLIPISSVQVGDEIFTTTAETGAVAVVGLITQVLIHPVHKVVDVAVIETTEYGELVGTPSHPIWLDGEWTEIQHAIQTGSLEKNGMHARMESRYVEAFYNLEVDGHLVDEEEVLSSNNVAAETAHSYTVHGIVASGLGDNEALNAMFARQDHFKQQRK